MSATNRSAVRRADDFYRTPAWVVRALLESQPLHGPTLEPACGDGAIMGELVERHYEPLIGVELDPDRYRAAQTQEDPGRSCRVFCGDYLQPDRHLQQTLGAWRGASVVSNPPYKQAAQFVRSSLARVQPGGRVCMLLRLNFLGSSRKRLDVVGPGSGLARVIVLARRPSFTGGGPDACEYMWAVWVRGYAGEPRISIYTEPAP